MLSINQQNILKAYVNCSDDDKMEATVWYKQQYDWLYFLTTIHPYGILKVAAIVAALSPMVSWEVCRILVEHSLKTGEGHHAMNNHAKKATRILNGELDPVMWLTDDSVSKTKSFFKNLLLTNYDEPVIDRHAYAAWKGVDRAESVSIGKRLYLEIQEDYKVIGELFGVRGSEVATTIWLHKSA